MRVLFTVIPERTTFLHTVPLAWALRAAGHDVAVASAPSFADTITRAGLTAVPVGRDASIWRVDGLDPERMEESRAGLPPPWNVVAEPAEVTWLDQLYGHFNAVEHGHKPENFPIVAGAVEFARFWRPDLVLWEPLSYAGAIAAEASGAVHARMLWSIDVLGVTRDHYLRLRDQQPPDERADPLAEWLAGYGRKYGFEAGERVLTGHFTLDQMPGSVRLASDRLDYLPIQYIPYGGPAIVPKWLRADPGRPRVGLTLGTTATERFGGYSFSVQAALDALAGLDVDVVATIADGERSRLGTIPGNVRVVPFAPLADLAASCSAMINHCGPGTFLTTARSGVPQLHLPLDFDEPELARRSAAQGNALTLHGRHITGDTIRAAVLRLLGEPTFGERAAALRDELRAMPSPAAVVAELEELTITHRDHLG
jgi:glycosyltransferase (activator-dependent family)